MKKFGEYKFPQVWVSKKENSTTIDTNNYNHNYNTFELPNYFNSKTNDTTIIKIFIYYTFDDGNYRPSKCNSRYNYKKWKPNDNQYDRKILTIKIDNNTTIEDLKKYISYKTKHNLIAIDLFPHPELEKIVQQSKPKLTNKNHSKINNKIGAGVETFASNYLNIGKNNESIYNNKILQLFDNNFIFYICELVEMSSNGFC